MNWAVHQQERLPLGVDQVAPLGLTWIGKGSLLLVANGAEAARERLSTNKAGAAKRSDRRDSRASLIAACHQGKQGGHWHIAEAL